MSNWEEIARRSWTGARVTSETPLAGDASTRRYVRLGLAGGGAPPTAVAMVLSEPTPPDAPELPFLNVGRHLASLGLAVPALYADDDRGSGVLLLEDVGDRALAEVLASPETPPGEVERRLAEVAGMLTVLATSAPTPDCAAYRRSHDEELIRRELDMILTHGLAASDDGPARSATGDPEARAALGRLGDRLAAQPRRLMHRDFHAWNLHVDPGGRLRVFDFQDAMLGPTTYDLASFCTDRDSDHFIDDARERFLLDHFGAALARAGADLYADPAVLRRDYYTSVAFRTLRVIGRFRVLAIEEENRGYLHYIPGMAKQTLRALDALDDGELGPVLRARSEYFA